MSKSLENPNFEKLFLESLSETVVWCEANASVSDPTGSLRNLEPEHQFLMSQGLEVFCVQNSRHHELWMMGRRDIPLAKNLCGGRLLAYFPWDNLACGAAEKASRGFFDVDNIPPFDTWVWLVEETKTVTFPDGSPTERQANWLVAWVPPAFLELARRGIDANPEKCIRWVDELDNPFCLSLKRLGLLKPSAGIH